jgi:hypothetical protein
MRNNRTKNIEATILSSFLDVDYYDGESAEVFRLDAEVFGCEAYRYIAEQINRFIDASKPMSLLYEKLDTAMGGTKYEIDYLYLLGRVHLNMSLIRKYYSDLVATYRKEMMKGIV